MDFDKGYWYRIATEYGGDGMCLDVYNGGDMNNFVHPSKCDDYSGQYWAIEKPVIDFDPQVDVEGDADYYRLYTMFRHKDMCLTTVDEDGSKHNGWAKLDDPADQKDEHWLIYPSGSSAYYAISPRMGGKQMALTVYSDGNVGLALSADTPGGEKDDLSRQRWKFTKTDKRIE